MSDISRSQLAYLKKYQKKKRLINITRIVLFLIFLFCWELAAQKQWIDSFIFSSPSKICITFKEMLQSYSLLMHIGITLAETLLSFFLVFFIGTAIAILLWAFPTISKIMEPYFVILNSLPKSALAPLLIVWLGANQKTIIVAGLSVAIFGSIINLYTGFRETDTEKLKLIQTFGGNKYHQLIKIVLPASIPLLLSTMKVNIGLCLVGVIIGEFIGARQGLGYLIIYGSQVFKLDWVILSIIILCFAALFLYGVIAMFERILCKKHS